MKEEIPEECCVCRGGGDLGLHCYSDLLSLASSRAWCVGTWREPSPMGERPGAHWYCNTDWLRLPGEVLRSVVDLAAEALIVRSVISWIGFLKQYSRGLEDGAVCWQCVQGYLFVSRYRVLRTL